MFHEQSPARRIELLERLTTLERLSLGVASLLQDHGIRYFFFGLDRSLSLTRVQLLTLHNLPAPWARQYLDGDLCLLDPTVCYARAHQQPISWRQLEQLSCCATSTGLPVLAQHRHHGLRSGLTLPLRGDGGTAAWLTLACSESGDAGEALLRDFMPQAVSLAGTLHDCVLRLAPLLPAGQPTLSQRERDCLTLASDGLTNSEIGAALGISNRTAIYHIANACRKVGARNRQQAITRALLAGQLGRPHERARHADLEEAAALSQTAAPGSQPRPQPGSHEHPLRNNG